MQSRQEVFLSHSGLDREVADSLSKRIEQALRIKVFNTSGSQDRFKDFQQFSRPGMDWWTEAEKYDAQLKDYLRKNLLDSNAYLLLVTERSLRAQSSWIEFEMQVASEQAEHKDLFFFPVVTEANLLGRLPRVATRFQGIAITSENGFGKLLEVLRRALEKT